MATSSTVSDGKSLAKETKKLQSQFQKPDRLEENNKDGTGAPNFPARYFPDSDMPNKIEAYKAAWQNFAKGDGDTALFQKPVMPKELVRYIEGRQEQETLLKFEEWLFKTFDFSDPNVVRYVHELYPDYMERRLSQLDADISLMKRLAKIRLQGGPQSREDLQLRFAIDAGLIDTKQLDRSIIWPDAKTGETEESIVTRGWWNPRLHVGTNYKAGHVLKPLGDWLGMGQGNAIKFPGWSTGNEFYKGSKFMKQVQGQPPAAPQLL